MRNVICARHSASKSDRIFHELQTDHITKLKIRRSEEPEIADTVTASTALKVMNQAWAALALLIAAMVLQTLAGHYPQLVEQYYSRGLYRYIASGLSFINRRAGFSIAELLLILLLPGALWWLFVRGRKLWRFQLAPRYRVFALAVRLLWLAGGGMMIFLLLWGLNYQRQPLAYSLTLEKRALTNDEMEAITRSIIEGINRSYEAARANRDWREHSQLPFDRATLYQLIEDAYRRVPLLQDLTRGNLGSAKPVFFSPLMSRFGITGVYNPFTGEPNYNAEQPDYELPYTIAHEKAHQYGFAQEDEASFIAFLVCTGSTDPYLRYSGYMHALSTAGELEARRRSKLPDGQREPAYRVADGPRADLKASAAFWNRYRGWMRQAGERVNDKYLKANRVPNGVTSYNGVNDLIIRYYLKYPPEPKPSGETKQEVPGGFQTGIPNSQADGH